MKTKRSRKFVLLLAALFVLLFGVGYAYLTQRLDITGKIGVEATCPIFFDNVIVDEIESNVLANTPAARRVDDKTIIDFAIHLTKPGDVYTFDFDTVNEGNPNRCDNVCIDGIELIIKDENNGNFTEEELAKIQKALKYRLSYTGTDVKVRRGNTLPANQRKRMHLEVTYTDKVEIEDILQSEYDINASLVFTYDNDECRVPKYTLTVDPKGGKWEGSTDIRRITLAEEEERTISDPVKIDEENDELPFVYWNVKYKIPVSDDVGETTLEDVEYKWYSKDDTPPRVFTMPAADVTMTAEYRTKECNGTGYKAAIVRPKNGRPVVPLSQVAEENEKDDVTKYCWLQDAINDSHEGETIYLIKNTDESEYDNRPTNNKNNIIIDLNRFSLYGTFINPVDTSATLINGTIQALEEDKTFTYHGEDYNKGVGIINEGTLTIGENDGEVLVEDSIAVIGVDTALKQNGTFYFFDGYLEGVKGIAGTNGKVTNCPRAICEEPPGPAGYFVVSEHINVKKRQKVYLSDTLGRAVAVENLFYYNLQDGIIDETDIEDPNKELRIIRDQWEASYELFVPIDTTVNINMDGFKFTTGDHINVYGNLNIYNKTDKEDVEPQILTSESIIVRGKLTLDNFEVKGTNDEDVIVNQGDLEVKSGKVTSVSNMYAINNTADSKSITLGHTAVIQNENSTQKNSMINRASKQIVISDGTVFGLQNEGNLKLTGVFTGKDYNNGFAVVNTGTLEVDSNDIDVPKLLNSAGTMIYRDAGVKYTDFAGGTGYIYSGTYSNGDDETIHLSGGTMNIEDGLFKTEERDNQAPIECGLINSGATLNLNGGTIQGQVNGLCNQAGRTNQYNANITGGESAIKAGVSGSVYIEGGETIGDKYGIYMYRSAQGSPSVVVNKGHVEGKEFDGIKGGVGSLTINGGVIEGFRYGINNPYVAGAFSCTFYGCSEPSKENVSNIHLNGGTVMGGTYGIYNEYIVTMGSDDRNIGIDAPYVVGNLFGIYSKTGWEKRLGDNSKALYFYDGKISGQTGAYNYPLDPEDSNSTQIEPVNATEAQIVDPFCYVEEEPEYIEGEEISDDVDISSRCIALNARSKYLNIGEYNAKINALVDPYLQINDDDSVWYTSLDRASNAASSGDVIKVIKDANILFPQTVVKNKNLTLDLNGHDVLFGQSTTVNSNLVLTNSSDAGTLTLDKAFSFNQGGKVKDIKIVLNDGAIINDYNNDRSVEFVNSNVSSVGTTIYGKNSIFTSGEYKSRNGYVFEGSAVINGGTLTSTNSYAVNSDYLTVNGGLIESKSNIGIYNRNDAIINAGEVRGITCGIDNRDDLTIKGGLVKSSQVGVCNYKNLVMTGGKIYADTIGINSSGPIRLGVEENEVERDIPVVRGLDYGIKQTAVVFEWLDGKVQTKGTRYEGIISLVPNTYVIVEDEEDDEGEHFKVAYLDQHVNFLRVGSLEFNSFNDAVAEAITSGETIYLIKDARTEMRNEVASGVDVTFDLNGHSLITTQPIKVNGTLSVKDGKTNGSITNIKFPAFEITSSGVLNVVSGNYTSSYEDYAIKNSGTLNIIGGKIYEKNYKVIYSVGTINISGGEISTAGTCGYGCPALHLDGGYTNMSGGTITNTTGKGLSGKNEIHMTGGTIEAYDNAIDYPTKVMVDGGFITSTHSNGIYNGNIEVNGGEITGYTNGIEASSVIMTNGKVLGTTRDGIKSTYTKVVDGTIISEQANGISIDQGRTGVVEGGYVKGGTYGIKNDGTLTLGVSGGELSISSPLIMGDMVGLFIKSSGTYNATTNFYDGILKGGDRAYTSDFTTTEVNTQPTLDQERIDGKNYQTAYLIADRDFVRNERTGTLYKNLQLAFEEATEPGDILTVIEDAPIYYDVTLGESYDIKLNLNSHKLTTTKGITNKGVLYLYDGTQENRGSITTSVVQNLLKNQGTLTVDDLTIKNTYSSAYLITSSGTLNLNDVRIEAINGVETTGVANITRTNMVVDGTGISNSGELNITGGSIEGVNYCIYSNSNKNVSIENANYSLKEGYTNRNAIYIANNTSTVDINNIKVLSGWFRNGSGNTTTVENSELRYAISNGGTLILDNTKVYVNSEDTSERIAAWPYSQRTLRGIANTGDLTIQNNSQLFFDYDVAKSGEVTGIYTTNKLKIEDSSIKVGYAGSGKAYKGIEAVGRSETVLDNIDMEVISGGTVYAIYQSSSSYVDNDENRKPSKLELLSGHVKVTKANLAYGIYNYDGETIMGAPAETTGADADVNTTNPLVEAYGSQGIGVKKVNGRFRYFDGKIIGSTHSKPEVATQVEYQWEATTYFDENTGNEYTVLEYMLYDYDYSMVARMNGTYYTSIQAAIDNVEDKKSTIEILKNLQEDFVVPSTVTVKMNLNNHRITGHQENNGTLTLVKGSLTNYAGTTITNTGTLILGENDGDYKEKNVIIYSEGVYDIVRYNKSKYYEGVLKKCANDAPDDLCIKIYEMHGGIAIESTNDAKIKMYDGYVEGIEAIKGNVTSKAPGYQVHLLHIDVQPPTYCDPDLYDTEEEKAACDKVNDAILYERKYLTPYEGSDDSCDDGHFLYLDPNGGIFNNTSEVTQICLAPGESYTVKNAKYEGRAFKGWTTEGEGLQGNVVTMGDDIIELLAQYDTDSSKFVAQIGEYYYLNVNDAIYDATPEDTILVLKNTTEDITNTKNVTIDLNGKTITGSVVNEGTLNISNGNITSNDIAIENKGTLTLGVKDGEVLSSPVITGTNTGIKNTGTLNFYDGKVVGKTGITKIDSIEDNMNVYVNHVGLNQEVSLTDDISDAVVQTKGSLPIYYLNVQDGFNTVMTTGQTLYEIKDASITYTLSVPADKIVTFDMQGYTLTTSQGGSTHGTLNIVSTSEERAKIDTHTQFVVYGTLNLNNVYINQLDNGKYAVNMSGNLTMVNAKTNATNTASVILKDNGDYKYTSISVSDDSEVATTSARGALLINATSKQVEISSGLFTNGIYNASGANTVISGTTKVVTTIDQEGIVNDNATMVIDNVDAYSKYNDAMESWRSTVTINGGTFKTDTTRDDRYALIVSDRGTATINGGTFISNKRAFYVNANVDINDATINGKTFGLYVHGGTCNIGSNDGVIDSTKPVIQGDTHGLYRDGGSANFYDGIIKSKSTVINGALADQAVGSELVESSEYQDEILYKTNYLVKSGPFLRVGPEREDDSNVYESIDAACEAVTEEDSTIYLIRDASVKFDQTFASEIPVTFDLNGYALSTTNKITNNANLTIVDSDADKKGRLIVNNQFINTNEITINPSTIQVTHINGLRNNSAKLTLNGGTVINTGTNTEQITDRGAITAYSSSTINIISGTIKSLNNGAFYAYGSNTINITNADIISEKYVGMYIYSNNTLNITDVNITSYHDGIYLRSGNNTTITSATINTSTYRGIDAVEGGTLVINGGTYNGAESGICNQNQTVTVNDGTFTGGSYGIYNLSSTQVNDGTFTGGSYGIYATNGTITLGTKDSEIDITKPTFRGELYGVYQTSGTVNFYDGEFYGVTDYSNGLINAIEDDSFVFDEVSTMDETNYIHAYLKKAVPFVVNEDTGVEYKNLQLAISEVEDGERLKLLSKFSLFYDISIPSGKNFSLEFDGYSLTSNHKITNAGTVVLKNSKANTTSRLYSPKAQDFITNSGTMTIDNVNLTQASDNWMIHSSGTLTLKNLTFNNNYGVQANSGNAVTTFDNVVLNYTRTGIDSRGILTINNSTITGGQTAVYTETSGLTTITDSELTGTSNGVEFKGVGNKLIQNTPITGMFRSSGGTVTYESTTNELIELKGQVTGNSSFIFNKIKSIRESTAQDYYFINVEGNIALNNCDFDVNLTGGRYLRLITSNKDVEVNNSKLKFTSNGSETYGITTSGAITFNNVDYDITTTGATTYAINNTKTTTLSNSTIDVEGTGSNLYVVNENGSLSLTNTPVNVTGTTTNVYGYFLKTGDTVIKSSNIILNGANVYGITLYSGTLTLGENDGNVSTSIPLIKTIGTTKGIILDRRDGIISMYDGKLESNTSAYEGIIRTVPKGYEIRNFNSAVDEFYSILMDKNATVDSRYVARVGNVYYTTVQDAIDTSTDEPVVILQNTTEDLENNDLTTLDLNGHTLTSQITNNNTLNIKNGDITSSEVTTIINDGTLLLAQDDDNNFDLTPNIINTNANGIAIENNNIVLFNSGSIEAKTPYTENSLTATTGLSIKTEEVNGRTRLYLGYMDLDVNGVLEFDYTGEYQVFRVPKDGIYKLEAWEPKVV